jgi:site-specific DNA-methyltransferase (adenine-specific)
MVTKVLKTREAKAGFVYIPVKKRAELLGDLKLPFTTKLNDTPALMDEKGRLRCSKLLKNKFPINSEIILTRRENGFEVQLNGKESSSSTSENAGKLTENSKVSTFDNNNVNNSVSKPGFFASNQPWHRVLEGDCIKYLNEGAIDNVHLTFFDPPYLQGKEYRFFDDNQSSTQYWNWVKSIVEGIFKRTSKGGSFYFMHREKNAEIVLRIMREAGWNFQNLIIWRKKTSAVPIEKRFSKQYQIIVYAIKGDKPRVFNKIRIDPPPLPWHKYEHENGVYLTDVWDDIRELTSGYFAGDEALRDVNGKRMHVQQTPVALLLRIILSSSLPGDVVFDPTAGTGTTLVAARQLNRNSIGIEIDSSNIELVNKRLSSLRQADDISSNLEYYKYTRSLTKIWS